jgi:hypothetical protein
MKNHIPVFAIALLLVVLLPGCTPPPPPELSVSVSSSPLLEGSQATVHVRVTNPSADDWQNYKLLIGYAPENDPSMVQISEVPLSLAAGQTFEQDVPWLANFQPAEGLKYQVRLALVSAENAPLGETSAAIEFVHPTVAVNINPTQLTQGTQAVISLQVTNPSGVEMQGYTLSVGYGAAGDSSSYMIQDLPINLKAGETFSQDITWKLDYVPSSGNYEIRAALIMPGSVFVTQSALPITLTAP